MDRKRVAVERVIKYPIEGLDELVHFSVREGFTFLSRLQKDWMDGSNQFMGYGEGYYSCRYGELLIGLGGISKDPYVGRGQQGRIRRFYVHPNYRRKGVGRLLMETILASHRNYFQRINLYTDNGSAAIFYQSMGFDRVQSVGKVSHSIALR